MYRIEKRKDCWYINGQVHGRRVRKKLPLALPRKMVQAEVDRLIVEAVEIKRWPKNRSVDDAVKVYLKDKPELGPTSRYYVQRMSRELGSEPLWRMTAEWLNDHLRKSCEHDSPALKRRYATMVRAVVNHAAGYGWCDLVHIRTPNDGVRRERFLSEEEERRLFLYIPEYAWPAFAFMVMTGCRIGELVALEWKHITEKDDGSMLVELSHKKGRGSLRRRHVPLNARAVEALDEQARLNGQRHVSVAMRKGPIFRRLDGKQWHRGGGALRTVLGKAAERAGIEDVTPHDLRRTFASRLVQRGVSMRTIADLLGHSNLKEVMHYAHLSPGLKEAAVLML